MKPTAGSTVRVALAGLAASAALLATGGAPARPAAKPLSLIVQGRDMARAAAAVRSVGGTVTHELGIIDAVAATVTPEQAQRAARLCSECRVYADRSTRLLGWGTPDTAFPTLIGANVLHTDGVLGANVTVAVVDSGFLNVTQYLKDDSGSTRLKAQYDAFTDTVRTSSFVSDDGYGHGSHVTGIIASSKKTSSELYQGIAPRAELVSVKAFDQNGGSTYATVIRGIDWVVANRSKYKIRVLNASFGAPVASWYWNDPLNQAVMRAWEAGIVVVTAAGNTGPGAMTIQAPGNVPYLITVGAMTDNYTPSLETDDYLATFSAAGPTYEGHVKPDLVAPGGHDLSWIQRTSTLGVQFPQYFTDSESYYFRLSGTSQAAAVVSGVVALMLDANSTLSPDDVKCGLMATARVAQSPAGSIPYSVFQQGAGRVAAWAAVHEGYTGCANGGLDISQDLAGTRHFAGPVGQDADGNYYLVDQSGGGTTWNGTYASTGGYPWTTGYPWSTGYPWTTGYPWSTGYPWTTGYPWSTSSGGDSQNAPSGGGSSPRISPESGAELPPPGSGVTVVRPGAQQ